MRLELGAPTVEDTRAIGAALARLLQPGDDVALTGDLGAGKTTLVQGVARGLEVTGTVVSPTFTLVREYEGRLTVHHADVYRLDRVQDVDPGRRDLHDDGVLLVEWGRRQGPLPAEHPSVELTVPGSGEERRGAHWRRRVVAARWSASSRRSNGGERRAIVLGIETSTRQTSVAWALEAEILASTSVMQDAAGRRDPRDRSPAALTGPASAVGGWRWGSGPGCSPASGGVEAAKTSPRCSRRPILHPVARRARVRRATHEPSDRRGDRRAPRRGLYALTALPGGSSGRRVRSRCRPPAAATSRRVARTC
jgi:tRNA threonylcarbamoyladenosine biosynthesis protein TsaE